MPRGKGVKRKSSTVQKQPAEPTRPLTKRKTTRKTAERDQVDESGAGEIPVITGISAPSIGEFKEMDISEPGVRVINSNIMTHTENMNMPSLDHGSPNLLLTVDLDIASHVPLLLRQRVMKNEYINLALLLKGSSDLINHCSGGDLFIDPESGRILTRPPQVKEKIPSIEKWTDAFLIYMNIFLRCNQDKNFDLLKYLTIIRSAASRCPQGDFSWRTYDEQFRLRLSSDPSMSWANINGDLWAMTMVRPVANAFTSNNSRQNANITPSPSVMNRVCYDYNKGSCFRARCRFSHHCSNCSAAGHNFVNCPSQQKTS